MPRQKSDDRLGAAIKARAALDAEIKELQDAQKERKRQEDDRRFMLLGKTLDAHMVAEPTSKLARDITAVLDRNLTRPADRSVFALSGKPASKKAAVTANVTAATE